jgi:pectate lyase
MKRNALYVFLILVLAAALAALAQSPTSSNMGGSQTKDPYGATLDHPNPGSTAGATGQSATQTNVNEGQTPASGATTATPATPPSDSSTTTTTTSSTVDNTSGSSTSTPDTSGTAPDTSTAAGGKLPRTASDLPLLATIGLLALGGALTVRSLAKRNT